MSRHLARYVFGLFALLLCRSNLTQQLKVKCTCLVPITPTLMTFSLKACATLIVD
jgi:hypothetical protein